jgi:hypothetical protein
VRKVITPGGKGPAATFTSSFQHVHAYLPKSIASVVGIESLIVSMPVLLPRSDLLGKEVVVTREPFPHEKSVRKELSQTVLQYIGASAAVAAATKTQKGEPASKAAVKRDPSAVLKHLLK